MKLLRGDAHFTAEPELAAVRKAGGSVDIDGRAVNKGQKGLLNLFILGNHRFAVSRGVTGDMLRGRIYVVNDGNG